MTKEFNQGIFNEEFLSRCFIKEFCIKVLILIKEFSMRKFYPVVLVVLIENYHQQFLIIDSNRNIPGF